MLAGVCLWNDFDEGKFYGMRARWPRDGNPVLASHFATWDAAHYLYLSEVGYAKDVKSCAFYPLWPLLVRGFAPLLGGSHVLTGLVLANAFSLAAWALFHRLVARRWGESAANWALAFLIAFPGALFFQFNYTESLFLLLVLLLWWGPGRTAPRVGLGGGVSAAADAGCGRVCRAADWLVSTHEKAFWLDEPVALGAGGARNSFRFGSRSHRRYSHGKAE